MTTLPLLSANHGTAPERDVPVMYLQFGTAPGPCQTVAVPFKRTTRTPNKGATASGYGRSIPTSHMILWEGRWRRVRVTCWGNAGSPYVLIGGDKITVQD